MDLDDNLWIPFVWDTVYTTMNGSRQRMNQDTSAHSHVKHKTQTDQESQNSENEAANDSITYGDITYCGIPLSQVQSNQVSIEHCGESQSFSSRFNIPSRPNDIVLSSVDINRIVISHGPDGVTQNQIQSLSVSLAQQSVNMAHLSTSLNIPEDITDDTSLTLTHNSEKDTNNVDHFSDVSEPQSIDINSINLNKHVPNDCESLPIEINHISVSRSHDEIIQNHDQLLSVPLAQQDIMDDMPLTSTHVSDQDTNNVDNNSDVNESQSIDINSINLNNHASNDCESPSGSDNIATRVKAKYSKARQKKIHKKSQKSNTRRRNNIYNQTCKKSRKTQTRNLDILSPSESLSIEY